MNPELRVILQKDAEGNGYSPLSDASDDAVYVEESTWSGELYDHQDAGLEGIEGEDVVVLYPIN